MSSSVPTKSLVNRDYCALFNVVLVEPEESLNIGSVARAMMNLGFYNLHLIRPKNYDRARAQVTACWAGTVLDQLKIHDSPELALSEMQYVS